MDADRTRLDNDSEAIRELQDPGGESYGLVTPVSLSTGWIWGANVR